MQAIQARVTPDSAASEGKVRSSIKSKRSLSRQDALEADEPPTNCDDDVKININFETQGEALNNSNNNNSNNNNNNNNNNNSTTNRSSSDNSNSFINFDDNSDYTFEDAKDRKSSSSQNHPCVEELPPSLENNETCTPSKLHLYSREGNLEMVRGLLSSGADVNGVYRDGNTRAITPLNLAVRKRRHDVARQLLAAGANVDACEEALSRRENVWMDSYSPLHWAVENGDEKMAELLLNHGANRNKQASLQDHQFVTPLHLAAQDGNTSICRLLLSDPECLRDPVKITPKRNMITPLHQAAFNGHTQTVRLLLDMGCDPNKQADNGYAALHYACQIGDPEMVRMILSHGGSHDLKSFTEVQSFITPLHLAVQSADEPTIRLLASYGADLEAEKKLGKVGGMTPLHQAVYQNKLKIVKLLIDLGADVHSKSGSTWYTVCHIAAEKGHLDMIDLLLSTEVRADINAKAALGEHDDVSPLHVASQFGHNGIIKKLVKAGADINCVRRFGDRSGMTCLHLAVEFGHADTVQLLTNLGCNVNAADSLKYTPLHTAVQHCRLDMVKLLLACNKCNLKLKNISGLTPKQLAKKTSASVEITALFRENQGSGLRRIAKSKRSKSAVFKYLCGL